MEELRAIEESLVRRPGRKLPLLHYVESAVIVPLLLREGRLSVLFTRRTGEVKDHKKQISFPGGVREEGDRDLAETALRETEEEIGLEADCIRIIGGLDEIYTVTGYRITPFAGIITGACNFQPNRREIQEILDVPLRKLLDPGIYSRGTRRFRGERLETCFFKVDRRTIIWGATATILTQFLKTARGPECAHMD